jgi:hypothetical protein
MNKKTMHYILRCIFSQIKLHAYSLACKGASVAGANRGHLENASSVGRRGQDINSIVCQKVLCDVANISTNCVSKIHCVKNTLCYSGSTDRGITWFVGLKIKQTRQF